MAKTTSKTIAFMTILTLTAAVQAGSVLYVDDDAPPNGDGTSWETAYRFLQDALTEVANGGIIEIRIAQGLYRPDQDEENPGITIDQHATFELVQAVALVGGYAGIGAADPDERDIDLYETILTGLLVPLPECGFPSDCCSAHKNPGCDCGSCEDVVCAELPDCCAIEWDEICATVAELICDDLLCDEPIAERSFHVVTVFESNATLDGLTIRDGIADWPLPFEEHIGGGVLNFSSTLSMIDCTIIDNVASRGAGIYNFGGDLNMTDCKILENWSWYTGGGMYNNASDATITNCQFIGNSCWGEGGGGMYNENSSPTIIGSTFEQNTVSFGDWGEGGGGILNIASSPFLLDCHFIGNLAQNGEQASHYVHGGGMFNRDDSNPLLINCTFVENIATNNTQFTNRKGIGGGLANLGSSPTLIQCMFLRNDVNFVGGGLVIAGSTVVMIGCEFVENTAPFGAGIYSEQADSSIIAQCSFVRNQAYYWGGAVFEWKNSSTAYINSTFFENSALGGGAVVSAMESQPTFTNCMFIGNLAEYSDEFRTGGIGGALASWAPNTNPILVNCTLSMNSASVSGGGVFVGGAYGGPGDITTVTISNSILWNNLDQSGTGESAQIFIDDSSPDFTASVYYSTIEGLTGSLGGIGNIGDDPLFVDIDGQDDIPGNEDDDLRLQPGSPAIDAAFNNAVPADLADLDEDDDTNEFTPIDLDSNPRFADAPKSPDTGCGVPVIVDMGAYEYLGNPIQPCLGDADGDLIVNTSDLLILLGTWGTCDGCCLADFDANGSVNTSDLLILFANWGQCG